MPGSRPFEPFEAAYVVLPAENVDTDQIIPARFLKTTERTGLGAAAFHDWRHRRDGSPDPAFPLNRPEARGARVLVAGRNFGCGSSREHAVWALLGAGFDAVVSTEFADIFRGNALGNGLLPIQVAPAVVETLTRAAEAATGTPGARPRVAVDLEGQRLLLPDGSAAGFPIAPFAKHCLLHGIDEMDFLLGAAREVEEYEARNLSPVSTFG